MKKFTMILILCQGTLHAGPRSSANYEISTDLVASGGGRAASSTYSNVASVGDLSGVATVANPETIARYGFVGQLYEVLGYELLAPNVQPPEEGSTQITPLMNLDDGSVSILSHLDFSYSVFAGPITAVLASGLVETGPVYENTPAIVQATSRYFQGPIFLNLTILDTLPDNFGTYAADGLPDAWQIGYFGLDNPLAAALLDPDGDGQSNRFEYVAGLVPTDSLSRFELVISEVAGQPGQKELKFSPTLVDRTYTVKSNTTLTSGTWDDLTDLNDDNLHPQRTVIDLNASSSKKFYKVEIVKP